MKVLLLVIFVSLILQCFAHFPFGDRFKKRPAKTFRILGLWFKSLICRVKHHKTVLNENNDAVACTRKCPTNYIEKYSFHWGHHCKPIKIPEGCADEYCVRCKPGYNWIYTFPYKNRCVKECPLGYMVTAIAICQACTIEDCHRCKNTWTCTQCNRELVLYKTFMGSVICVATCPEGYKITTENNVKTCSKEAVPTTLAPQTTAKIISTTTEKTQTVATATNKVVLPEGCQDKNCVRCSTGYFKYFPPTKGSHCVKECPVGYTTLGFLCVACSDRRCASCKASAAECDKCYPGFIMLLDAFNITMECVRTCPTGYKMQYVNNVRVCIPKKEPACPVANCKKCIRSDLHEFHKGCGECLSGFTLFRGQYNDHCYTSCPSGHFESLKPGTEISACARCKTPFCTKCTNKNICTECIGPLVLDVTTRRCTVCPQYFEYSFIEKECISADVNQPESINYYLY